MAVERPITFLQRPFPSANSVIVHGSAPILIDSGFGSDADETERLLIEAGVAPGSLALIVNTHYHSDHVGGNFRLQRNWQTPIAAHEWDAHLVNGRDGDVGAAVWLDQPIEPYHVTQPLTDGDVLERGGTELTVIAAPGHTRGQIALYAPRLRLLICGDAAHADDPGWINFACEGEGALEQAIETLDRLGTLDVAVAYSGHGPPITDPASSFACARARYERWLREPRALAWHACKRIFAYALMIHDGLAVDEVAAYLTRCPWFCDHARECFDLTPPQFVAPLVDEMLRAGAARIDHGRLVATVAYRRSAPDWPRAPTRPCEWPREAPT